jgi:thioredoxin-related protein
MRRCSLIAFYLLLAAVAPAQVHYTTFEQLDSAVQAAPRKTFVLIRTSWCAYCNMMEHTTLQNKAVVQLLNSCFYSVSLDAEQQQPIYFKGKKYAFQPRGNGSGMNELAALLMQGEKAALYPSFVLLDEQYHIIFRYSGYIDGKQLLHILQKACAGHMDITASAPV